MVLKQALICQTLLDFIQSHYMLYVPGAQTTESTTELLGHGRLGLCITWTNANEGKV